MDPDRATCSEKYKAAFYRTLLLLTTVVTLFSCSSKEKWIEVDPAFSRYIDAYTTGVVSKTSTIRIQLAAEVSTTHAVGEAVKESLFDLSPSVKGKAFWLDARTIEFKPDAPLTPDQVYTVKFKLGKVSKVPDKFSDFRFSVKTVKPSFKVTDDGLRSSGVKNKMSFSGDVETADVEEGTQVEKLLTATQSNKSLAIKWQHNDATKMHHYIIENLDRGAAVNNLDLRWDGKPMNMETRGTKQILIPAAGDFKVLNVVAVNDVQQYASVQFSDPIAVGQELTGLVTISNQSDIAYTINGSEVKVYANGKLDGSFTVYVNAGIKNTWSDVLASGFTSNVFFENRMPAIKIHGKGNILPNSGRLVLPFDAINLNAVDISSYRKTTLRETVNCAAWLNPLYKKHCVSMTTRHLTYISINTSHLTLISS